MKKVGKVVKWYFVLNTLCLAFIGTREVWRNDDVFVMNNSLVDTFYSWKYHKYVNRYE